MKREARDRDTFSYEQSLFAGGVATIPDPRLLTETQFAGCLNAYPARNGRIRKRPGFAELLEHSAAGIMEIFRFITEEGYDLLVWWDRDGSVYYVPVGDPLPAPTELLTGLDTSVGIAVAFWHNDLLFSDGVNGLYKIIAAAEDRAATLKFTYGLYPNLEHLTYTTVAAGVAGNSITIEHSDPGTANQSLSVGVVGSAIKVNLATDAGANIMSTIDEVVAAVNASAAASALVTASGTGESLVPDVAAVNLMFGADQGEIYCYLCTDEYSFIHLAKRQASERLFGVQADDPTNLRWCEPFDPTSWPGDAVYSPGGNFVASAEVGNTMVAFTDDLLYRIDGSDPATWNPAPVQSDGLGCVSGRSVCVIEGIPVYLSHKGIAYYDGGVRPKPLSEVVYDGNDPGASIVPSRGESSFALSTGELYVLFYPSDPSSGECDRAAVYDFRMSAWGGPWTFERPFTCGHINLRGRDPMVETGNLAVADRMILGTGASSSEAGSIAYEDPTSTNDFGEPVLMMVKSRAIDGARPLLDKIYVDCRLGYEVSAETTFEVGLICEDESTPRDNSSATFTVTGSDAARKRIPNNRAKWATPYVSTSSGAATVEVFALGADLFFCRTP